MSWLVVGTLLFTFGAPWISEAFALKLARKTVMAWERLITRGLSGEIGHDRVLEVESHLAEQIASARADAYQPRAIALQLLVSWLLGIPSDLAWRVQQARLPWRIVLHIWAPIVGFSLFLLASNRLPARVIDSMNELLARMRSRAGNPVLEMGPFTKLCIKATMGRVERSLLQMASQQAGDAQERYVEAAAATRKFADSL